MGQFTPLTDAVKVNANALTPEARKLLTSDVLELLTVLHRELEPERARLLQCRTERQAEWDGGKVPGFTDEHPAARGDWTVAPIPEDLLERRVEITGPINSAKMVINMLSPNQDRITADMAMLDFEDSMKPSWKNVTDGVHNLIGVAEKTLRHSKRGTDGRVEKTYELDPSNMAHPMVRVRGLHLDEANVTVDGKAVSAGLFDLALCASHTAKLFMADGKTPKYYVPKCEHYLEARWWNRLFQMTENALGLDRSSLRTTFLIETLPGAFQMEEILYEIRERACGLNGGRWDKIFSDIKVLKHHPERVLANRSYIDMTRPWMDNYAQLLVKTCHKHGAFGMGGMSAFTPGSDAETRKAQTQKVQKDKAREASIGHDGCWVSHPYFITVAREQFTKKNQLDNKRDDFPERPNLLPRSEGPKTMQGLRTNIRVGMAYLEGWNYDIGCVAFDNLMEDLATLEISRAQVWQWLRHGVKLDDGPEVTRDLVSCVFEEEMGKIVAERREAAAKAGKSLENVQNGLHTAKEQARELFLQKELTEFLTTKSPLA